MQRDQWGNEIWDDEDAMIGFTQELQMGHEEYADEDYAGEPPREPMVHDPAFDLLAGMQQLQQFIIRDLIERAERGALDAKELAVAAKLLKDNGITLLPNDSKVIDQQGNRQALPHSPPKQLPDFSEADNE